MTAPLWRFAPTSLRSSIFPEALTPPYPKKDNLRTESDAEVDIMYFMFRFSLCACFGVCADETERIDERSDKSDE